MFFYPSDIFHFHSFVCPLGSQLGSLLQKCDPDRRAQNSFKNRLCFFTHQAFPIFISVAVPWDPSLDPRGKSVILTDARKIHINVVYVFYPSDIFHERSFGCPLGSRLGPLLKKCNPDMCMQHSRKSRLRFIANQNFAIFVPLAVSWDPILVKLCRGAILTIILGVGNP